MTLALCLVLPACSMTDTGRRLGRGMVRPFAVFWRWSGSQWDIAWRKIPWNGSWRDEKLAYETRIQELEAELAGVRELREENLELRRLMQAGDFPGWRAVTAAVIGREPATWNESLVIGKGTADGLSVGLAVLAGGQVIGRLTSCERRTATVSLLSSPDCRISALVGDTGVVGVCEGEAGIQRRRPEFVVDYLPRDLPLDKSIIFRTSGMGNWMPSGLPLGRLLPNEDGSLGTEVEHARLRLRGEPLTDWGVIRFVQILAVR